VKASMQRSGLKTQIDHSPRRSQNPRADQLFFCSPSMPLICLAAQASHQA
jgi:hypothetical protein